MSKLRATLEEDLDGLLGDLCVEWGFCNRLWGQDLLREHPTLSGEDFARAVLVAEKMDADLEVSWLRKIRWRFTDRYGGATISEASFQTLKRQLS